ncbi:hypothetical protein [Sphingomonas folli]
MWSARYASNTLNNLVNDVFPKIGQISWFFGIPSAAKRSLS